MVDCESIFKAMDGSFLVRGCDRIADGGLRISTPFFYPDGASIDLFVERRQDLFEETCLLSDLGQTTDFLLSAGIAPWGTRKRRQVIADICEALAVQTIDGRLVVAVPKSDIAAFPDAMLRLGQACVRVSDLLFTKRLYTPNVFREEIEEFFSDRDLQVEPQVRKPGRYGKQIEFDFLVRGGRTSSLVLSLSTANSSSAHQLAIEAFARWHDLEPAVAGAHQRVTIYDSNVDVFRDDDLGRLRDIATVLAFPAQEQAIVQLLAA